MKWERCTTQWEDGESFMSTEGGYRISTRVAGFGIQVTDIRQYGDFKHRITGHNSVAHSKAWCESDYARIPELHFPSAAVGGEG
jgi:hypothetical protein